MKPSKEYQFRAYEVESEGISDEKTAQPQISVVAPKQQKRGKHPQESTSWQIETFLDSKKAHGVTAPKPKKSPRPAKQPKAKAAKKAKPPRKRWFSKKERAPEVSPLESGATTIPDILAPRPSKILCKIE